MYFVFSGINYVYFNSKLHLISSDIAFIFTLFQNSVLFFWYKLLYSYYISIYIWFFSPGINCVCVCFIDNL